MKRPHWVYGLHPVQELLATRRRHVEKIFVAIERRAGVGRLLKQARQAGVPVSHVPRDVLARKVGAGAVHQGIAAQVAPLAYAEADEVCRDAAAKPSGLLVLVDRLEDPQNLGAILRTCAAAGVDGVILGSAGTVGLTPAVAKVSAGAVETVRVARESRPVRRLEALRKTGFQTVALDPRGSMAWNEPDLTGRTVFVAGGEGRGLAPSITRVCDHRVAIPLANGIESLNVAVALGVLLFEAARQRRSGRSGP